MSPFINATFLGEFIGFFIQKRQAIKNIIMNESLCMIIMNA